MISNDKFKNMLRSKLFVMKNFIFRYNKIDLPCHHRSLLKLKTEHHSGYNFMRRKPTFPSR